jgi:hypothetical protein
MPTPSHNNPPEYDYDPVQDATDLLRMIDLQRRHPQAIKVYVQMIASLYRTVEALLAYIKENI